MSNEEQFKKPQPRRRGPMGRGMQPGEKPKNLKKSLKTLAKMTRHAYNEGAEVAFPMSNI